MPCKVHRGAHRPVRRGFLPQPLWLPSDLICSPTVPGRVSVICPAHNAERFLPEAIRSCLWQEPHPPDEIVLVDDGSTDETWDVIRDLRRGRPEIVAVRQNQLGPSAARNRAIRLASGEFVIYLDADDLMPPDRIALTLAEFAATGADFIYGQKEVFERDWRKRTGRDWATTPDARNIVGGTGCGTNSVAVRRHLHVDRGVWLDETMSGAEDAELLIACLGAGASLHCSKAVLVWRRSHAESLRHFVDWRQMRRYIVAKHREWLEAYTGKRMGMGEDEARDIWQARAAAGVIAVRSTGEIA